MSNNSLPASYTVQRNAGQPLLDVLQGLVRQQVQAELRRLAAEEAALWATAFGPASPKTQSAKVARVMHIASARAIAAEMRAGISSENAER